MDNGCEENLDGDGKFEEGGDKGPKGSKRFL